MRLEQDCPEVHSRSETCVTVTHVSERECTSAQSRSSLHRLHAKSMVVDES